MEQVTVETFKEIVVGSPLPVVVVFTSDFCTPCRLLYPVLLELEQSFAGRVRIVSVDTEEQEDLAAAYQILSIPTLLLFRDGALVSSHPGARPKDKIAALITEFVGQ